MSEPINRGPSIPSPVVSADIPPAPRRRWGLILAGLGVFFVLVSAGGFVAASALEEHDSFCVSCHTAPEVTYFNRAYLALDRPADAVPDLSTAHYAAAQAANAAPFRCIDCHRGDSSLGHRISTLALGAYDAAIFFAGREDPTIEKHRTKSGWLANASCSGCHADTLLRLDGINNHFHTYLPEARTALHRGGTLVITDTLRDAIEAARAGAGGAETGDAETDPFALHTIDAPISCSDCHPPHKAIAGGETSYFMDTDLRNAVCIDCHVTAQEGPQDVNSLSGEQGE